MNVLLAGSPFRRRRLAVVAYLGQMRTHGRAGLFRIVTLDCFKNPFVMNLASLWSTGNTKDAQALLAQKSDDRIEQREDQRVGCTFRESQMKIQVGFNVSLGLLSGAVHHSDCLAHGG